jgi:antitoxin (DNA-binding transcriptional repressor) of toxin-antitoxin stability system
MVMKVNVTNFKAKCTQYIRDLGTKRENIEITRNGKVVAVVSAPPEESRFNSAWGCLSGTITDIASDFDEPLGDNDWDTCK